MFCPRDEKVAAGIALEDWVGAAEVAYLPARFRDDVENLHGSTSRLLL
jgi:hypothetical protein